jgi:Tfp pilus assembly protein PilF
MSANGENPHSTSKDSTGLYEGEPEVVFATEFPVASAEEAITRADNALINGDIDLALYMYVRAYDLEKDNLHALVRIGEIHELRGNTGLASRAFTSALRIEPTHARTLQSLGLLYLQEKRHDQAQTLLQRAVAENPSLWRAQNGIGVIADIRGEHDRAIEAYDAALEANPDDASLLNNRGYSLYLNGKYEQAAQDFVLAGEKGAERAWLNLGLVLARQEHYGEAVQMMSRMVALEVAYNDVGYIAMRQSDFAVADNYFRKAIRVSPRYFEAAQRNLAQLHGHGVSESSAKPVADNANTG